MAMATPRLTFLYPHLFRSVRTSEPVFRATQRAYKRPKNTKNFAATSRGRQTYVQRHGKAVEPFLKEGDDAQSVKVYVPEADGTKSTKVEGLKGDAQEKNSSSAPLSEETEAAATIPGDLNSIERTSNVSGDASPRQQAAANTTDALAPLETVLQMPPPESQDSADAAKAPHLQTPPYVHHFDTYTLVQQVESGGFTKDQSITAMKAVRSLLATNLDVAKAGLVSKSDVENETYLFRAACSELRTEIQNSRKAKEETMRRERTLLTHEVEILNQKLTQELLSLKDDLKGMFDDRKMSVRMEQRTMESAIQELNYKITVMLNSDSKSEVEGLRWVLTRRSVMGILFMAFMVLTSLRYASYKSHEDHEREKKKESQRDTLKGSEEPRLLDDASPQGVVEILAAN
ncbi:moz protein represents a chromatin-associated acetyltransferase [Phlyctema vagabunda]|uniref:Moz protein represents a chromatin-associated acetyltransferase n=1 Tax=Phlyctema vagabunda TaxID=108571 RepID=A0ABR4PQL3_9HELO